MVKKKEISFLIIGAIILVTSFFYLDTSDTLFGVVIDQFSPIDWDEVHPMYIVKNSIPIELLETNNNSCTVKAENFEMIINHQYFIKNNKVTEKLQYDAQEKTLVVPCDELQGEKSRLNILYVTEESPQHAMKWEYFITAWDAEIP
ncbi:MAG: hypothetical protein IIB02_03130 [Thaumarchaeota archaeon]|nr:hypothetical protein [Nitrososphaerota archaeon]